jgi:hypothetical protein
MRLEAFSLELQNEILKTIRSITLGLQRECERKATSFVYDSQNTIRRESLWETQIRMQDVSWLWTLLRNITWLARRTLSFPNGTRRAIGS